MQTIAPFSLILIIRSHQVALALQGIPSALQRVTIALHRVTLALWQVTLIMQSIAIALHQVTLALHRPSPSYHQKILTKKSIDTLVQDDRLVYAIAMLVLSQDERNG
jgi:hypothetical protein